MLLSLFNISWEKNDIISKAVLTDKCIETFVEFFRKGPKVYFVGEMLSVYIHLSERNKNFDKVNFYKFEVINNP